MVTATDKHLDYRSGFPLFNGYIIALEYVPKNKRAAYEEQCREWMRTHPKKMWPDWLAKDWPETKKRLEAAGA